MNTKNEWKPIESHPVTMPNDGSLPKSLLYSPVLGIVIGTVAMYSDRMEPVATVPGFHGNAIDDWGVTHWMPLPEPPAKVKS